KHSRIQGLNGCSTKDSRLKLEHDKNKHSGGCKGSAWDANSWKRQKAQIDTMVYREVKASAKEKKRSIFEIQKYEDSDRIQKIREGTEQSEETNQGDKERTSEKN
ncbi:hypothetical protein HHI36_006901, partial [Cryptolaemus montrouzieri]